MRTALLRAVVLTLIVALSVSCGTSDTDSPDAPPVSSGSALVPSDSLPDQVFVSPERLPTPIAPSGGAAASSPERAESRGASDPSGGGLVQTVSTDRDPSSAADVPAIEGPLRILSAAPMGQLHAVPDRQPISVMFSRPLAADSASLPPDALTLDPAVPGSLRWEGTQTLVYTPTEPLPPATDFTVKLSPAVVHDDTTQRAAPYTWSFQTPPPRLVRTTPADGADFVAPDASLRLSFSLPVDANTARDYLSTDFPIAAVTNDGDSTIVVEPDGRLPRDRHYTLTVQEGLPSRSGDLPLPASHEIDFRVRPTLSVTDLDQPNRDDDEAFYPDRGLELTFSTPVRFKDLRTAISSTPALNLLPGAAARDANRSTHHVLPATLEPDTTYRLTLRGLQDQFGQTLDETTLTFETRSHRKRLHMDRGLMVIEASQHAVIPVQSTNVDSVALGMEQLAPDEIVPALASYDEETYYDHPEDAPSRPAVAAERIFRLPIEPNALSTVPLVLDSLLTPTPSLHTSSSERAGVVGIHMEERESGFKDGEEDAETTALAQVTQLGVTGKFSPHNNLIVVTELATGEPVEGATVTIRGARNNVHWTGETDEQGRAKTPGWHDLGLEKPDSWSSPVQYAIVEHEGDLAFTGSPYDDGLEPYRFDLDYDWAPEPTSYTGTVFSDRGLYKAGDTVHLKALLRTKTDADWNAYQDSVQVEVEDARNETVVDRTLSPNDLGGVHLDWSVPSTAELGTYDVQVETADNESIATGTFKVQAFRRASFAVNAQTTRDHYIAGDQFGGRISAHYLFGAGMEGQPVTYELDRDEAYFDPPGYDGFQFGPVDEYVSNETLLRTETTLDTASSAQAPRTRLSGTNEGTPLELTWRGTVTSPSRQEITDQTTALLHPGRYYVGLRPNTSFMDLSSDSTLSVDVVTVSPRGSRVADKIVTVDLIKEEWNSVREVGADGRLQWDSERVETVMASKTVTTQSGPINEVEMTVPEGGRYRLRARSRDLRGNRLRTDTYLYASGSGYVAWQRDDDDQINLIPEKRNYAPGETARLMVQSPYEEATALVTVEREGIIESRVQTVSGSTPMIELPITDEHLPNVFVSVILLKGRTARPQAGSDPGAPGFKIGYAPLSVSPEKKHLKVKMDPDRDEYRPGQTATVDLQLVDQSGEGVPGEITFSAADAGVLNLIDYTLPDPFDTFYGPRPLGVTTTESLAELVEQRSYGQKARETGGGGTKEKAEARTDFDPLAHWAPAVRTDDDGTASVSFELPESLTTFRFMATAHTKTQKFGATHEDVVVTKPLVLKPALPRFARIGDRFEAGVLVSNRSDTVGTATISATAEDLTRRADTAKTVRLPAGATKEVRFDWRAPAAGTTRVTFRGRMKGNTDALTTPLPVSYPTTTRSQALFASTQGTASESFRPPSDRRPSLDELNLTLSSTALVGLDGAVEHLFEYPYGCLEQRTSRIRPLLAGDDLLDTFDLKAFDKGNRDEVVQKWIGSLRTYWTGDGFSLWKGGHHVNEYVTGYVLMAMAEAEAAGYDVPTPLTEKTIDAVEDIVQDRSDRPEYYSDDVWRDTRAFLLYALARHDTALESEINWLANHPPESVEGKTHLLRTLLQTDQPDLPDTQAALARQLANRVQKDDNSAHLTAPDDDAYGWIFSSDVRSTAFGLTALLQAPSVDDMQSSAQRMIRYLLRRRQGGHWSSTQDNVAVLTAFQEYVETYESTPPDLSSSVALAGKTILQESFKGRTLKTAGRTLGSDVLPREEKWPLSVQADGTGRLYYSMRLKTYTTEPQDAASKGLTVERTIQRLDDQGNDVGVPKSTGNDTLSLNPGELVKVTVHLSSPKPRTYVAVDDALPAGLEPINENFATANQGAIDEADTGSDQWWGSFNHTEKHDDRVVLFADYLDDGEHTYSYVARATTPGTFTHPPAEATMMYEPDTRGRTATGTVIVRSPQ